MRKKTIPTLTLTTVLAIMSSGCAPTSRYNAAYDQGQGNVASYSAYGYSDGGKCHFISQGMGAYNRGDYAQALYWLGEESAHGNTCSETTLAYMYFKGQGTYVDTGHAAELLSDAATKGNATAAAYLSDLPQPQSQTPTQEVATQEAEQSSAEAEADGGSTNASSNSAQSSVAGESNGGSDEPTTGQKVAAAAAAALAIGAGWWAERRAEAAAEATGNCKKIALVHASIDTFNEGIFEAGSSAVFGGQDSTPEAKAQMQAIQFLVTSAVSGGVNAAIKNELVTLVQEKYPDDRYAIEFATSFADNYLKCERLKQQSNQSATQQID